MISNTYYLLNKAASTVISQFQPEAKTRLLLLMLSKRESNLHVPPRAVTQEAFSLNALIFFTLQVNLGLILMPRMIRKVKENKGMYSMMDRHARPLVSLFRSVATAPLMSFWM